MDDLALDRELDKLADQALEKTDGDLERAITLLLRWVEAGQLRGLADRTLRDYVSGVIAGRTSVRALRRP